MKLLLKRTVIYLFISLLAISLIACTARPKANEAQPEAEPGAQPGTEPITESITKTNVQEQLAQMTLEEKIGQMFMIHAYGASIEDNGKQNTAENQKMFKVNHIKQVIEKYHIGGIAYFVWTDNIHNPLQIARLSNDIQQTAMRARMPVPLLIAADQEQGLVVRINQPATQFPGNMALGATNEPKYSYEAAKITAEELKALGINFNFAPVADVNVNPQNPIIGVRSFSSDAQRVSQHVAAQVRGIQEAGLVASPKHFPGHGNTDVDSHTGLPVISHTLDQMQTIDLPPFQAAIEAGTDVIMSAHIVVPALDDSGRPATLSHSILTDVLRGQLGFEGVIITDALRMEGVREQFSDERVPVEAILAGVDLLLMPPDLDLAYHAVLNAVRSGEITQERIDQSVERILQLKYDRGLYDEYIVDEEEISQVVGAYDHWEVAERIAEKSVTLLKNETSLLPLNPTKLERILVVGSGESIVADLARYSEYEGIQVITKVTGTAPDDEQIAKMGLEAKQHDAIIVATMNIQPGSQQQKLVQSLQKSGTPIIVISVRNPYDINTFPDVPAYLATYSSNTLSLKAAVKVIFGHIEPQGRLPVDIPAVQSGSQPILYPLGSGLDLTR